MLKRGPFYTRNRHKSLGRGQQALQGKLLHVGARNNGRTTAYMEQKICAVWGGGRGRSF